MDKLQLEVILKAIDHATAPLKAIRESSSEAAKAVREAKVALKELEQDQGLVEKFRETSKWVAITGNQLKTAQEKVRELRQEMDATDEPTRKMVRAFEAAKKEAGELKDKHAELIAKQQTLRTALADSGIDTTALAENQRRLKGDIAAATSEVNRQTAALTAHNEKMRAVNAAQAEYRKHIEMRNRLASGGAATLATGVAMGAPIALAVKNFETLETSSTLLQTSMMDASGKIDASFDLVMQKAIELGNVLPGTAKDFVDAARALKQQGMSSSSVVHGGLTASAYLGVRFGMDQERAAEFVAKAREAHGLRDEDLPRAADHMHRAREAFGLRHDDIYESMKYAATDLNLKNQVGDLGKMKEYLVMQGMASQAGLEGSTFGTNFSHMLKQMARTDTKLQGKGAETHYVAGVMDEFRLKLNFYQGGQFLGFQNMIHEFEKLKVLTPQDQERVLKKLFDTEGSRAAGVLLKQGTSGFLGGMKKVDNVAGLNQVIGEMGKTLSYQRESTMGNLENVGAAYGKHLGPWMLQLFKEINAVIGKFDEFNTKHPVMVDALVKIAAVVATVTTALGAAGIALAAILGPLAAAKLGITLLSTVSPGLATALGAVLGPIGKITAAFTAGYAAGTLLNEGISLLLTKLTGKNTNLGAWIFDLVQAVKAKYGELTAWFKKLPEEMAGIGHALIDGIIGGIKARMAALKSTVTGVGQETIAWLKNTLGIKSPSKVFQELGIYTMQGLEQGITGGQGAPLAAISRMAKQLAGAGAGMMLGAGAAMAGNIDHRPPLASSAHGGGVTIINQITIQAAPGMNERTLAEEVARQIEQIERTKAARGRSRLGDRA